MSPNPFILLRRKLKPKRGEVICLGKHGKVAEELGF